ncbi:MAG: flagellar biosynthetic protein FliR [Phycisphaerae bacterium]|nr:flagellar biosynthetic protein FliR [Phycisphaerae bacterium]
MACDDEIIRLVTQLPLFLPVYALILFRVAGLMMTAPLFGSSVIAVRIRVAIAVVLSMALFPVVAPTAPAHLGLGDAVVGVVGEMMIGLIMGLALNVILVGPDLGGMISGQQAGLGLGQSFNPMTNSNSSVFGQAYFMVFQTVFLLAGGHRALMGALLDTFEVIPLGSFRAGPTVTELIVSLLTSAFILGLRMAAPVLIALFAATLTLGVLAKTMPQLNILSVGFAIRVMLALGVASLTFPAAYDVFIEALSDSIVSMRDAFGLGPTVF